MLVSNFLGIFTTTLGFSLVVLSGFLNITNLFVFIEWELLSYSVFNIVMTILVDWVSVSFMGFVMIISGSVMIYSGAYMMNDYYFYRFILLVSLFVLSMLFMIMSPNMVSILLGWDGLGLVSYCLVIYYQNFKSCNAGLLTILSNRVGDVAILLAISWLFNYGSWNFYYLQFMYSDELWFILMLVMLAALTKSAQIPFSAWLPAAMAAPTPVSALVHSSTLVTAGVYLLIRFSELMGVSYFLLFISVCTMFMSGVGAYLEMDLKKIIALSTLSQLGVMMMSLSLGLVDLAYFHLLTHALFKSLLFLCAGVFIHGSSDKQDIRLMGGVSVSSPITSFYFLGCSLALCGFPFMSGFYSKDLILDYFFGFKVNLFIFTMILLATFFTILYSIRLFIFVTKSSYGKELGLMGVESMTTFVPMSLLFFLVVVSGSCLGWGFMPCLLIFLPLGVKLMILIFMLFAGLFMLSTMMNTSFLNSKLGVSFYWLSFLGTMWWLPTISVNWKIMLEWGENFIKYLDQGWGENFGAQGIYLKLTYYYSAIDEFSILGFKKIILFMSLVLLVIVCLWA